MSGHPPPRRCRPGVLEGLQTRRLGGLQLQERGLSRGVWGAGGGDRVRGRGDFFLRRRFLGEIEERRMFHPRRSGPPFSRLACSLRSDDRLGGDGREGPRAAEAQGAGLQSFSCAVTSHAGRRVPRVVIALVSRVRSSSRVTKISQR